MAAPARAALDPGLKTPYQLRIVLHLAEHRVLTSTFHDQLEYELRDHLRLTYGKLAKVEVTRVHPLLKDVRAKGLQALDGWEELSDLKTHFVLIDYADGQYRLQARQHDGTSGLSSPVVRRSRTAERRLVALTAARLVDRDFGLSGTVTAVEGDEVKLALRGGGLGVPLGRWLRPGDVFAVARLAEEAGKPRAARVEWALLQARDEPKDGVCSCRLYHRYKEDTLQPEPGVLGYRGLRVATIQAPLRLRLVDDKTGKFLSTVRVRVGATGFDDKGWERTTALDGLVVTPDRYQHVAFVRVFSGATLRAQVPVELVDDRTVVCRVNLNAEALAAGQLQMRKERWIRRTYESMRVVASRFADLNAALERSPETALGMARRGHKAITAEIESLADEHDQLRKGAGKGSGKLDLSEGELELQQLQEQRTRLDSFIKRLDALVKEANSPETKQLQTKLERARLREAEADFEGALRLYQEILAGRPGEKQVAAHLEKLKAAWRIRDGDTAHTQAREFIYNTWPRQDTAALKTELPQAVKAFEVCRERGDRLTPQRLSQANLAHAAALKKRLDVLRYAGDSEDNRAETKALVRVAAGLRDLQAQVTAFLRKGKASP